MLLIIFQLMDYDWLCFKKKKIFTGLHEFAFSLIEPHFAPSDPLSSDSIFFKAYFRLFSALLQHLVSSTSFLSNSFFYTIKTQTEMNLNFKKKKLMLKGKEADNFGQLISFLFCSPCSHSFCEQPPSQEFYRPQTIVLCFFCKNKKL